MRVKKNRLDPETVVLLSDWLTPVARLVFCVFFSLSSPCSLIGQDGTGSDEGSVRQLFCHLLNIRRLVVLVWLLVQHKKNNSAETHSHREALLQTHPVTQKAFKHNEKFFNNRKSRTESYWKLAVFPHSSKKSPF